MEKYYYKYMKNYSFINHVLYHYDWRNIKIFIKPVIQIDEIYNFADSQYNYFDDIKENHDVLFISNDIKKITFEDLFDMNSILSEIGYTDEKFNDVDSISKDKFLKSFDFWVQCHSKKEDKYVSFISRYSENIKTENELILSFTLTNKYYDRKHSDYFNIIKLSKFENSEEIQNILMYSSTNEYIKDLNNISTDFMLTKKLNIHKDEILNIYQINIKNKYDSYFFYVLETENNILYFSYKYY